MGITEESRDALETRIGGKILFTPGHTGDSVSLKVGRVIFPGDAAMNGFPSSRRITIWVENPAAFGRSWDLLISEDADMLYPAHVKPFAKEELVRFRQAVYRIRLYALE
jgi:glyoxylase-like metal-dependent hydrolase (beta-lactamase superfamily II)